MREFYVAVFQKILNFQGVEKLYYFREMGNYIFGFVFFPSDTETPHELFGSYLKGLNSELKQGKKGN